MRPSLHELLLHARLNSHAWWWRNLVHTSSAAVSTLTRSRDLTRAQIAYRIVASVRSGRRPTWRWRWWHIIIWRSRWSRTWSTCLLCGLLLVVLIVCHIILITTISGIRILTAVILGVISSVICRSAGSWRAGCRWGNSGHWRLRSSIRPIATSIALTFASLLVAVAALLGWILLEASILLFDVLE